MRYVLAPMVLALSFALTACGGGGGPTDPHHTQEVMCSASATSPVVAIKVIPGSPVTITVVLKNVVGAMLEQDTDGPYKLSQNVFRGSSNDSFDITVNPTKTTVYTLTPKCADKPNPATSQVAVNVAEPGSAVPSQREISVDMWKTSEEVVFDIKNAQGCKFTSAGRSYAKAIPPTGLVETKIVETGYGRFKVIAGNSKPVGGKFSAVLDCDDSNIANRKVSDTAWVTINQPAVTELVSAEYILGANGVDSLAFKIGSPGCAVRNDADFGGTQVGLNTSNPDAMGGATCVSATEGYVGSIVLGGAFKPGQKLDVYIQSNGPVLHAVAVVR
jgi:hypothetical protein